MGFCPAILINIAGLSKGPVLPSVAIFLKEPYSSWHAKSTSGMDGVKLRLRPSIQGPWGDLRHYRPNMTTIGRREDLVVNGHESHSVVDKMRPA